MAVSERDEAGRAWGREWGWEEVAELVAVSATTALCCALRFPKLPPSDPAPRGLPALGKNITAEGKPLPVTSRGCLQLERSFKDGLGTRGAWAGTLPTMAQWIRGAPTCHPPPSASQCCCRLSPAAAGTPATSPATSQGFRLSSLHGRRDGRCWHPVSRLHSFLSVPVISQLICLHRHGVVCRASAGFPAVRVRNGT